MNFQQCLQYFRSATAKPRAGTPGHEAWLQMPDIPDFLAATAEETVPLYVSWKNNYFNTIIVPEVLLVGDYMQDLRQWSFSVSSGWGWSYGHDEDGRLEKSIESPAWSAGAFLSKGMTPVFLRRFEGRKPSSYIELEQQFVHVLGLHWIEHRHAYCQLDDNGDIEDLIHVHFEEEGIAVTIQKSALDRYLWLTGSVAVRLIDVWRSLADWPDDSVREDAEVEFGTMAAAGDLLLIGPEGSEKRAAKLRAVQIIRRSRPDAEIEGQMTGAPPKRTSTVSFLINDWKNKREVEWPADGDQLGNYYEKSDLPYETSPAFFRREVLAKFRQDPDKYTMSERSITCRGTWSLHYDISEQGQVHVYIYELARLPLPEQMYWKAFNEKAKGGISKRAFKSDFEAEFDLSYNPLDSLRHCLEEFPAAEHAGEAVPIWAPAWDRRSRTYERLHYVVIGSEKEWEDQVEELAKIVIDGLQTGAIKRAAFALGCTDTKRGSLGLLKFCLEKKGVAAETVLKIMSPLRELWDLRSKIAAHAGKEAPAEDLIAGYRRLSEQVDGAVRELAAFVESAGLNC